MMLGIRLRKGDTIKCKSREHVKQVLEELSSSGYHAVAWDWQRHIIMITGEPEGVGDG